MTMHDKTAWWSLVKINFMQDSGALVPEYHAALDSKRQDETKKVQSLAVNLLADPLTEY
jgi:hypothetical protein